MFLDRRDAGRQLGRKIALHQYSRPVVLALPRGGVPVAAKVASALDAPLDIILVRKIGVPGKPELAMGAVVDGRTPTTVRNDNLIDRLGITEEDFVRARDEELKEIERRRHAYVGDRQPANITGHTVIVVDDGIATGATIRAALKATRIQRPARLVVAVPVAPASVLRDLKKEADEVVYLAAPKEFDAVGPFYSDFEQVSDAEVVKLLDDHRARISKWPEPHRGLLE